MDIDTEPSDPTTRRHVGWHIFSPNSYEIPMEPAAALSLIPMAVGRIVRPLATLGARVMLDSLYFGLGLAGFVACAGFVALCARI
jgi:hypothetical protein